ncbi:hypothetical protein BV25DRAFT_1918089 [Artomyces pyxidatus]|uniref:Uncharacterized protein n=1 Tax=Artomyces pyxidatus TaxID=48021 RepID=A0ACB8SUU1_9AGAM|nr:hypothetical protein BV25DRAFT_1918089 [Artomyces pyxidatus]
MPGGPGVLGVPGHPSPQDSFSSRSAPRSGAASPSGRFLYEIPFQVAEPTGRVPRPTRPTRTPPAAHWALSNPPTGLVPAQAPPALHLRKRRNLPALNGSLSMRKQATFEEAVSERRRAAYDNLSSGSKRAIDAISGGPLDSSGGNGMDTSEDVGWIDIEDEGPLDQELEISGEGGETEYLAEYIGKMSKSRFGTKSTQSWSARILHAEARWRVQLPALVDAYMQYIHDPIDVAEFGFDPFPLAYMDVYDFSPEKIIYQLPGSPYVNVTLLRQGCLGSTPLDVSSAISLRTLELYRRLRLRQPRVSIQAWIKVICDIHNLTYQRTYWRHFSDTFDVYLKILEGVEQRVLRALGREDPEWRVLHSCPPCQYKLADETNMEIAVIGAFDGNQSLKRVRLREGLTQDPRAFSSTYYIGEDTVNRFQHDVKPRPKKKQDKNSEDQAPWANDDRQATAADGDEHDTTCTDRWKAAMSDSLKRMWAIYRETGIFLSACRHGMIWWICDMVESGELAKYPLAIIDQALRVFGDNIGMGYDIGCSFTATIAKSSLSEIAKSKKLRMAVNAFHGYAHNRPCQLQFHPLYASGFGLEDIETCERVFSSFNGLAVITRYAAPFHRHQAIDMYARQWDEDKYQELGTFLLGNYRQIQQILDEMPDAIAELQSGKTPEETDYHAHLKAEREFLAARKKESASDVFASEYVALLQRFHTAQKLFTQASSFVANPPRTSDDVRDRLAIAKLHAFENLEVLQEMVHHFEQKHGITRRWEPESEDWKVGAKYLATRDYQKALDKLEGLVVQRLFELAKMGLSGTGYKMRTHINKSLRTRCKAIQTALRKYNSAAKTLERPQLEWKDISTYGSLAEFELLRECREDIRSLPWTDSRNRQAAIYTLKIQRAEEERVRVNNEVRRLFTSMHDEEAVMQECIRSLKLSDPLLSREVQSRLERRVRMHNVHRSKLQQVFLLPCYTGSRELGIAVETPPVDISSYADRPMVVTQVNEDVEGLDANEDDWAGDQLDGLNSFMANLSLIPTGDESDSTFINT